VTKKDIVRTIAEQINLPQLQTRKLVQKTFDAIIEALVRDGRIELRNFGVFQIKKRDARIARNPRTGEDVSVAAKSVVTFKPGKEMEARVRHVDQTRTAKLSDESLPVVHHSQDDFVSGPEARPAG